MGNLLLTGDLTCACSVLLDVRTGGHERLVSRFVHEYTLFNQTGEGGLGVSTKPNKRSSIFSSESTEKFLQYYLLFLVTFIITTFSSLLCTSSFINHIGI